MLRFNTQSVGINWGLEICLKFNKKVGGALKNDNS